jgi:hypothetical protein
MPIARTRSIQIAAAAPGNPASVDTTTGLVDVTGLTFRTIECDYASINWAAEQPLKIDNTSTTGFEGRAPELDSMCGSAGAPTRRASGDVTISGIPMRAYGAGPATGSAAQADSTEMPLVQVLASVLDYANHGGGLFVISNPGANAGEFETITALNVGEIVLASVDGRIEAARVTDSVDTGVGFGPYMNTVGTYFSRALTGADDLTRGSNFQMLTGSSTGTVGAALAAKIPTAGGTMTCVMGRASSLRFYVSDGFWHCDATIRFEWVDPDISGAGTVTSPDRTAGAVSKFHGVRPCMSVDASPEVVDPSFTSTRLALNEVNGDVAVNVAITLAPIAATDTQVTVSDLDVTMMTVTASLGFNELQTSLRTDIENRKARMLVLPGCPVSDGATQANGCAFVLSAAYQNTDTSVLGMGGELLEQRLDLTAGIYGGDNGSETYNNAPFAIYLGGA